MQIILVFLTNKFHHAESTKPAVACFFLFIFLKDITIFNRIVNLFFRKIYHLNKILNQKNNFGLLLFLLLSTEYLKIFIKVIIQIKLLD